MNRRNDSASNEDKNQTDDGESRLIGLKKKKKKKIQYFPLAYLTLIIFESQLFLLQFQLNPPKGRGEGGAAGGRGLVVVHGKDYKPTTV